MQFPRSHSKATQDLVVDAVLFDLDGVLVDACEWHFEPLNRALLQICGITIDRSEHQEDFNGLPTRLQLEMLVAQGRMSPSDCPRVEDLKQTLTWSIIAIEVQPDPIKIEMLNHIHDNGIRLGCVTNSIRETAELTLSRSGQLPFFDRLITNQDVRCPKPDPEGYLLAIDDFSLTPDRVLIVENSAKGLAAALQRVWIRYCAMEPRYSV